MSTRRRHFKDEATNQPRCGAASDRLETSWKRVDCLQCQVYRYLHARREYDKRKAREAARLARPVPLLEETSMRLPDNVRSILQRYAAKFPIPPCTDCPQTAREESRRQWTYGFVQQVVFETRLKNWGTKQSAPGHPLSKDTITYLSSDGEMRSWDVIQGAGGDSPSLVLDAESIDTTGQVFVPVVGVDLLGGTPGPGDVIVTPPDVHPQTALILARLEGLEAQLTSAMDTIGTQLELLRRLVDDTSQESTRRDGLAQRVLFEAVEYLKGIRPVEFQEVKVGSGRTWGHAHGITVLQPKL